MPLLCKIVFWFELPAFESEHGLEALQLDLSQFLQDQIRVLKIKFIQAPYIMTDIITLVGITSII